MPPQTASASPKACPSHSLSTGYSDVYKRGNFENKLLPQSSSSVASTGEIAHSSAVPKASDKLVAYVDNNTVKALGVPWESRNVIHGKLIPPGNICVQISQTLGPKIPAPVVLGIEEENDYLKTNMFFALPIGRLFNYVYEKNTNSVKLSPYSLNI